MPNGGGAARRGAAGAAAAVLMSALSDENDAQASTGESGYYAGLDETLDRVFGWYVTGPLLEDNPDQCVIGAVDAALIVPGDDIGWLYKVWDDCTDCYGWATGGGREIPVDFTADALTMIVGEAVDCYGNYHGSSGYSSCAYYDDAKTSTGSSGCSTPTGSRAGSH